MDAFQNGPYTNPPQTRNNRRIPPQDVTDRKNKRRVWLYLVIPVVFVAGYFFGNERPFPWLNNQPPQHSTVTEVIPECAHEDGSTDQVCYWSDGSGDQILNMNFGQYTYNITRETLHTYWTKD